jgi:hypothetical protein
MRNFEDKTNRPFETNIDIDKILTRVAQTLEKLKVQKEKGGVDTGEIKMEDFRHTYGSGVDEDLERVRELKNIFAADLEKKTPEELDYFRLGKAFELVTLDQMINNHWLGESIVRKTSPYDDYENGADAIAYLKPDNKLQSILALTMDITTSHLLVRKFERIKKEIENQTLTHIRYFQSDDPIIFFGKLGGVPRVVIGADIIKTSELLQTWCNSKDRDTLGDKYCAQQEDLLRESIVQIVILQQMLTQLKAFAAYALELLKKEEEKGEALINEASSITDKNLREKKIDEGNNLYTHAEGYRKVADAYQQAAEKIEMIINKKGFKESAVISAMRDRVTEEIKDNLLYFHTSSTSKK